MSCCAGGPRGTMRPASTDPARTAPIEFEYAGASALSVIGGATRHLYRFGHPGARLPVHPRDAPGLLSVPGLRPVG